MLVVFLCAAWHVVGAQGWDVKRVYFGRHNKPDMDEEGVELIKDLDEFLKQCDVVSINVPLSDKTKCAPLKTRSSAQAA